MQVKSILALLLWGALTGSAAAAGDLIDVTVHNADGSRAAQVYQHAGRNYIVGRPGAEYRIRLRNRSGADILAVVSVDGVNAVSGETARWSQTGYVLAPGQTFDVTGWRKSLDRVATFFFTAHRNSYAARTGRPDNVGVIGVALFRRRGAPDAQIAREWPRSEGAARDGAPRAREGASRADAPAAAENESRLRDQPAPGKRRALGTGHGHSATSEVTYTAFDRATDSPEEVVVLHYDTCESLVAMGVIRGPRVAIPVPFPGQFVPDPR